MKILYFTKSKPYTCQALKYMSDHHEVVAVVHKDKKTLEGTEMESICRDRGIPMIETEKLYEMIEMKTMPSIDLAISNTYGRLIRFQFLNYIGGRCINLHGAILPDYKGLFAYNHGLLNEATEWGVTAHYVSENFDDGDIIEISRFRIDPHTISVKELEIKTQQVAYEMTIELIERWNQIGKLPSYPQAKGGKYYSLADFEKARKVESTDSADTVKKKIHAFYCPPYEGAYVEIDGIHFELKHSDCSDDL